MEVHRGVVIERLVKHQPDPMVLVIDQGEQGHRARPHSQGLEQALLAAKRQAGRAYGRGQDLQVDPRLTQRRDQPELALGVLEEQILGVAARQGGLDLFALAYPEHRRMLERHVGDAVRVEEGEQVLGRCGRAHAASLRLDAKTPGRL